MSRDRGLYAPGARDLVDAATTTSSEPRGACVVQPVERPLGLTAEVLVRMGGASWNRTSDLSIISAAL